MTFSIISGRMYTDSDGDNTENVAGGYEAGIGGQTVQLLNSYGTVIKTTTTDAWGNYSFGSVSYGNYYVQFPPSVDGGSLVTKDVGNYSTDSDGNIGTGRTDLFSVNSYKDNTQVDAGYNPPSVTPTPSGEAVDGENTGEVMTPGYDDSNAPNDGGGDIIDGADGLNDTILGNGGDDTIDAGLGDDLVSGGSGDDEIDGNDGNDTIFGDQNGAVVGDGERESFNWQGVSDSQVDGSFSQDTGNVTVTFTRTEDTGSHESNVDNSTGLNVSGIDTGGEAIDTNSSLFSETKGQGNTGEFQWEFSDPVSDVEFNINDLDGDGVVTVRAFDAAGNEIPVTLTGGSDINISGNVADADGPYQNPNDPDIAVQVNIAGPVSRIELEHTQNGHDNSGINVTDLYYDAGGIADDSTEPGDDTIDGGDGDDLIYGDNGGVSATTPASTVGTVPSEGGVATLLVWDASQLTFSGGNPFPNGTGGLSDSNVNGITMTLGDSQVPVGVGVQDGSSSHFNDGDWSQDLVNDEFIDGENGDAGDRITPEYSYSVQNTETGQIINVYAVELNSNQVVGFVSDAPMEQGATYTFLDNTSSHPSVPYGDLATTYIIPGTTGGPGTGTGGEEGGDDVIIGGDGEDTIFGQGGDDSIDGGADDDLIYGDNGGQAKPVAGTPTGFDFGNISGGQLTSDDGNVTATIALDDFSVKPTGFLSATDDVLYAERISGSNQATIDLTFGDAVADVSFTLFDVNDGYNYSFGNWDDQVTIIALDANGNEVPVSFNGNVNVNGNTVESDTLSSTAPLNDTNADNVEVSIAGPITSLRIIYEDGPDNNVSGYIGVGNLTATPVTMDPPTGSQGEDGGDDTIFGGEGEDTIFGQGGDDSIDGGADDDLIYGDNGGQAKPVEGTPTGFDFGNISGGQLTSDDGNVTATIALDDFSVKPTGFLSATDDVLYAERISGSNQATVDLTFGDAVSDVSFTLFDVNDGYNYSFGNWDDQVTIIALDANGNEVPVSFNGNVNVNGNTVESDTLSSTAPLNDTNADNVEVSIAGPITSLRIIYEDGPDNNVSGYIGVGNLTATPVTMDPPTGSQGEDGGDDTIIGGEGADSMFGEGGNDTFVVDTGSDADGDVIVGGNGPDETTDDDVLDLRGAGPVTIVETADATDDGATTGTVTFADGSTLEFSQIERILTDPDNEEPEITSDDSVTIDENTTAVLDVDATDPDGDPVTFSITGGDDAALFEIDPVTGELSFIDPPNFEDPQDADLDNVYDVEVTATDPAGLSDTQPIAVTVADVNEAPDVTGPTDVDVDENTTGPVADFGATDPDGDAVTFSLTGDDAALFDIDPTTGELSFKDAPDFETPLDADGDNDYEVTVVATDPGGLSDEQDVTISVGDVDENGAPTAVADVIPVDEDSFVTFDPTDNDIDPDGDDLVVVSISDPSNGTLTDNGNGTYTYEPDPDYNGQDQVTYTVRDPSGEESTTTVTFNVAPVNDAPDAVNDADTTDEETPITLTPLTNDTDVDGDTLRITAANVPTSQGTVTFTDDEIVFTPAQDFTGDATISYSITDDNGGTDTAEIVVTVNNVNDDPVAVDDLIDTPEDTAITFNPADNDTDVDGDPLKVTAVGPVDASEGKVTLNPDGTVTFEPAPNFNGPVEIPYTVSDGQGGEDTGKILVNVGEEPDAPTANDDADTTAEDTAIVLTPLTNDTDPDGDTLTITGASVPTSQGTLTFDDTTITFTPAPDFTGDATIDYSISDGNGGSDSAQIVVDVTPVNDDPVAVDDIENTPEDTPITFNPAENDTDVDGDPLKVTAVGPVDASEGTVTLNPDGTVTFEPAPNFNGPVEIPYTVSDGQGGEDTGKILVNVGAVNDAPIAEDDTDATDQGTPVTILPLANDSDPDGDPIRITAADVPADQGSVTFTDDEIVFTPAPAFVGDAEISYTISDGSGLTDTATVTVTVADVLGPVDGTDAGQNMQPGFTDLQGDQIDGTDGDDDTIFGNGGDDTIDSGEGDDTVDGGDGDDVFEIANSGNGIDNDSIIGGEGDEDGPGDVIDAGDIPDDLTVTFTAPETGTITDGVDTTTFEEIEGVITGSGDDTITGSDGDDYVDSKGGDDSMEGGDGNDTLISGDGDDTIDGGEGDDSLVGGDEFDSIDGGEGDDTIDGGRGDDVLNGEEGDDSILGGSDDDTIDGGADDDTIVGSAGNDDIDGGTGTDTYEATDNVLVEVDDAGDGTVEKLSGGVDTVDSVEDFVGVDNAGSDEITLTTPIAEADVPTAIQGLSDAATGNYFAPNGDLVLFGPGEDYALSNLLGGTSPGGGLPVYGPAGKFTITDGEEDGQIGNISFAEFETINFTVESDAPGPVDGTDAGQNMQPGFTDLQGDQIDGTDGDDDTIFGNGGDDTIDSGEGDDTVDGGDGDDVFEIANSGNGIDNDSIIGGEGDEDGPGDVIDAGDIPDDLTVTFTAPETGTITDGVDTTTFEEIEGVITGSGDDTITGSDGDDYVDSKGGDDSMEGGDGNDTLISGDGDDTIDGGEGDDSLVGGDEFDSIDGGEGDDTIDGGRGDDVLNGEEGDDSILGGSDDDTIDGGADDDTIVGSAGNDDIDGGTGTDTYEATDNVLVEVDDAGDGTVEKLSGGVDTVDSVEDFVGVDNAGSDEITLTTPIAEADVPTAIQGLSDAATGNYFAPNGDLVLFGPGEDYALSNLLGGTSPGGGLPVYGPAGKFTITDGEEDGQIGNISFAEFETINFTVESDAPGPVDGTDAGQNMQPGFTDLQGDQIDGTDGDDDTIFGNGGDDTIDSGEGDDTVDGGDGDDVFEIANSGNGIDNDSIIGGEGDEDGPGDVIDAGDIPDDLTVTFTAPETGTITDGVDTTTFEEIEGVITGSGDDTITGSDGDDYVDSKGGDDSMEGGDGNDTLISGDGDDTIDGGEGDDSLVGGDEFDSIDGGEGDDTIDGGRGDDVLNGEEGDDSILGGSDDDTIDGGADDDTIVGSAGNDDIDGGTGTDTYEATDNVLVEVDDAGDGTVEKLGGGVDTVDSVEDFVGVDNAGFDEITLTTPIAEADVPTAIQGLSDAATGNYFAPNGDLVLFGPGEDYALSNLLGGTSPGGGLPVYGPAGKFTITDGEEDGQIGNISFAEFETINFTVESDAPGPVDGTDAGQNMQPGFTDLQGDQIDGTDGDDDTIFGNGGDDTIDSGEGDDTVDGGDGDDTFVLTDDAGNIDNDSIIGGEGDEDGPGDRIDASDFEDDLTVDITAPETGTITDGTDTLTFEEVEQIETGSGDDTVTGSDGDDFVETNGGDDSVLGGDGNDTLLSGDGQDTIDGGTGDDSIVGGDEGDELIGGIGDDTIEGLSGPDTIDGGEGDDSLIGGEDDDTITGGVGSDTVEGGDGDNVIDTSGLPTIGNNVVDDKNGDGFGFGNYGPLPPAPKDANPDDDRDLVTTGSGDDTITTGDDADTVFGGSGDNVIDTGIDNDEVTTTFGDDFIVTGEGADTVSSGGGNDTIYGGNNPDTLPGGLDTTDIPDEGVFPTGGDPDTENGRDFIEAGAGEDLVFGQDDDDTIYGGGGADTLDGGVDDDLIYGGTGKDDIIGGEGADTMFGGADRDEFLIDNREDAIGDVIDGGTDGNDVDTLDLRGLGKFEIVGETVDSDGDSTSGTVNFLAADGVTVEGSLTFAEIERVIPCFTPGTLVATPRGEVQVQDLQAGDRVITRDDGIQEIAWIGKKKLTAAEMRLDAKLQPVLIKKGALGNGLPERDMLVSPNHRMLIANENTQMLFDEREVLVAAKHLVGQPGIHGLETLGTEYIHVMFERHQVILGDGAWTESFQPGDQTMGGFDEDQREELTKLFPSLAEAKGRKSYSAARQSLKAFEARTLRESLGLK